MRTLPRLVLSFFLLSLVPVAEGGQHQGERRMLNVGIDFSGSYGTTITDSSGIRYYYHGSLLGTESKVYPQKYWGSFPLYFFGTRVGVTVRVTNLGPRQKMKVRIKTEAYVLNTSGGNGAQLASLPPIDIDVPLGETKIIDASFVVQYTPDADSGLDRFLVKVTHMNEGGGPGNSEPGLIMVKEGVFCPPKFAP